MDRGLAPAKVNLALHVTGRRADGYHTLDSLVVFAGVGDQITVAPSPGLTLGLAGPFAPGLAADESNIVLRAARLLQSARGVTRGAAIRLTKMLPHPAGLGGGSADAAAVLRLLADLWQVAPLHPEDRLAATLGADVPVCLAGPRPMRLQGIGERLSPVPALPPAALVLVNPRVAVPTPQVFAALRERENPGLPDLPEGLDFDDFCAWLDHTRNDLRPAAEALAPAIGAALRRLAAQPGVAFAGMSGSGATCFGLCRDMGAARSAARAIQIAEQGWWVVPAELLAPEREAAQKAS